MWSCEEALEWLSAALDGPLPDAERAALDEHLSRCPACSALFEELRGLRTATASLDDVPAPAGFSEGVMAAIAADPAQERPGGAGALPVRKAARFHWKGWAAAAAVAIVALGAVTLAGRLGALTQGASSADTADCAAPAAGESSGAESPTEAESQDVSFDSSTLTTGMDGGDQNACRASMEADAKEDAAGEPSDLGGDYEGVGSDQAEMETAQADEQLSSPARCGVLTLTGASLPEGLEHYESWEDGEGNRTYEVPADFFFSCLHALEAEQSEGFTCELEQEDAASGLIIVRESS